MRFGIERLIQPALELTRALVGDGVAPTLRSFGLLDLVDPDTTALFEPTKGRIDLREGDRVVRREVPIDEALEVVSVSRLLFEEAEKGVGDAHAGQL